MRIYHRLLVAAAVIGLAVTVATLATPSFGDATQCVQLVPTRGGETLVNRCSSCVMATVLRSRTSSQPPISRQYSLRPRSKFDLPFKGPGRSRVTVVTACRGGEGAEPNLAAETEKALDQQRCIRLTRAPEGGVQLVNGCRSCREADVRRIDAKAENYADESVSVPGGKAKPFAANGFAHAVVIGERACF